MGECCRSRACRLASRTSQLQRGPNRNAFGVSKRLAFKKCDTENIPDHFLGVSANRSYEEEV